MLPSTLSHQQQRMSKRLSIVGQALYRRLMRRYPWPLVRALMAELMEQVLLEFEAEAHVEVRAALMPRCCARPAAEH